MKILLVEDDHVDVEALQRAFKRAAIDPELVHFPDALSALESLQSGQPVRPYIVLLDLALPGLSGLEFLSRIRKNKVLDDTVVFVLSTSSDEVDKKAAYKHQVAGYFVKDGSSSDALGGIVQTLDCYWKTVHLPAMWTR